MILLAKGVATLERAAFDCLLAGKSTSDIDTRSDEIAIWEQRAQSAQPKAAQAMLRLVGLAERSDTGQARRVAMFLAACFNGDDYPFDLFELRALDVDLSDDALTWIHAQRWAKADFCKLVPDGEARMERLIKAWGIGAKPRA